jgi:hypothetical protein
MWVRAAPHVRHSVWIHPLSLLLCHPALLLLLFRPLSLEFSLC